LAQEYDWERFEVHSNYFSFKDTLICESADSFEFTGLSLSSHCEMVLRNCDTLGEGMQVCRYDQYHKGLPVLGYDISVYENNGIITGMHGFWVPNLSVDTSVLIPWYVALDSALAYHGGDSFAWQDSILEAGLRVETGDSSATYYPELTKSIYQDGDSTFIGHYINSILGFGEDTTEITVFVANGGDSIMEFTRSSYYTLPTINPKYICNGDVAMETKLKNGWHVLRDETRNIHTKKLGWRYWRWKDDSKDSDDDWGCTEVEAKSHWCAQKAHDYYDQTFLRDGFKNNRELRISHNPGTSTQLDPKFGTKRGWYRMNIAKPTLDYLCELDVVGHEYTHAVIWETSAFGRYEKKGSVRPLYVETKALDESFSDIMGQCVEHFVTGTINWGGAVNGYGEPGNRNLKTGKSTKPNGTGDQPQVYGSSLWNSTGSFHRKGGVTNKWFQLLVDGGTHNGRLVTGIGWTKAEKLAYFTMASLSSKSSFKDAVKRSLELAEYYFGKCTFDYHQVQLAWKAVGLDGGEYCYNYQPNWNSSGDLVVKKEEVHPTADVPIKVYPEGYINDSVSSGINYSWDIPIHWSYSLVDDTLVILGVGSPAISDTIWITSSYNTDTIEDYFVFQIYDSNSSNADCIEEIPTSQAWLSTETITTNVHGKTQDLYHVFPQPSENILTIESTNSDMTFARVSIYDLAGRVVYEQRVNNLNRWDVVTSHLKGVYILGIEDTTGKVVTKKILIY
jgi:hypothetical protein